MKKKLSLLLCLVLMVLTMAACGGNTAKSEDYFGMTYEELQGNIEQEVAALVALTDESRTYIQDYGTDTAIKLIDSWDAATAELGAYQGLGEFTIDKNQDTMTLNQVVVYEGREVIVSYVYTYNYETKMPELTDASADLIYTLSEKMAKAGMNTLMGMGTVFIVLILISLIIYAFNLIPYFTEKKAKKKANETVENTVVAQVQQREEQQLTDDLELVAVISAAVAASMGTSTDAFVVRSIRRR